MFVVFEGGDGVGKSTQINQVSRVLTQRGIPHITTREPGGTPPAEAVRRALLYEKDQPWPLWAEVFLLAAARAHHLTHVIRPALARGDWVLCDRFTESTRAYQHQAYAENPALFDAIVHQATGGLTPDLTFVFQLDEGHRLSRRPRNQDDCFESRNHDFQHQVAAHFAKLAQNPPADYMFLQADQPIATLTQGIVEALLKTGKAVL
jgi:dTMP kinase